MINRGTHHVLFSETEIGQRLDRPRTVKVLHQLMEFYEARHRRRVFEDHNRGFQHGLAEMSGVESSELEEFRKLMRLCDKWLGQTIRINFKEKRDATDNSRPDADGADPGSVKEVNLSKAERRRNRRKARKDNLAGVLRSSGGTSPL